MNGAELTAARKNVWKFAAENNKRELQIKLHPDNGGDLDIFKEVMSFFDAAEQPMPTCGDYKLVYQLAKGDLCDVFVTECGKLLKRPLVVKRAANQLMAKEVEVCKVLQENAEGTTYQHYFPKLIASEMIDKQRINTFEFNDDLIPLPKIKDPRHIAWIFKRVLIAIGYAQRQEWKHNAVTPEHILICTTKHGVQLTGWIHAGDVIKVVPSVRKAWYNDHFVNKDIGLAVQSMLWSCDSCPKQMKAFFKGSRSVADAWELHDEFDDLLQRIYGKPKFIHWKED